MPAAARKGDQISHGGPIVAGSPTVEINGMDGARKGDPVACSLHGSQVITGGSPDVFYDGKAAARIGDAISCGAVIVTGSPDVSVD